MSTNVGDLRELHRALRLQQLAHDVEEALALIRSQRSGELADKNDDLQTLLVGSRPAIPQFLCSLGFTAGDA